MQTLKITAPTPGSTVSGVVTIKVTSTEVTRVNFYVDGVLKGKDVTTPFTFDWYTTRYPDGSHSIKVVSGNGKVSDVASFIVQNAVPTPTPTPTPTGFTTTLTDGMRMVTPYSWQFNPGEPSVVGYFWVDGTLVQKITSPPPYMYVVQPGQLKAGTHKFGHAWDLADGTHKTPSSAYNVTIAGTTINLMGTPSVGKTITASISCQ